MTLLLRKAAIAIMALLAIVMAAMPVAAQPAIEDLLGQLDGLQTAYARKYIADESLGFVTPVVADEATPSVLTATVLEFDTPDQARAAFDLTMNELVVRMILGESEIPLERTAVDGLGDQAVRFSGVEQVGSEPEHVDLLAVQDGNLGILIQSSGTDTAMIETVDGVAEFIVAAEPSTDPVTVDELTVSGGPFEMMPTLADDDLLRGLIPMYDYDLLLNGGTEPLGHNHGDEGDATPPD